MVKTITPFSTRAKEGATDSPLGDFVNVEQSIVSTADVGFYDENTGKLTGIRASDKLFGTIQLDSAVANGGIIIAPSANADGTWPLDMTGFNDIIIALKPTASGNFAIQSIMGPNTLTFGGLSPINSVAPLGVVYAGNNGFNTGVDDGAESLTADVWNIYYVQDRLRGQKVLQFKITNNTGGSTDMESAFLRVVV